MVDGTGAPFQLRGSSTWCLVQTTRETVDTVLDKTVAQKFNSVVVMAGLSEAANDQYGPEQAYGTFPFVGPKLVPNEAHWEHVAYIMRAAARRKLVVQLAYCYAGHPDSQDGFASRIAGCTLEECFEFGAWLGATFGNFANLIWICGGDNKPETDSDKWDAIVAGILSEDDTHLFSGHPQRAEEGRIFGSYITLNSIYRNRAQMVSGSVAAWYGVPTLPGFMFEGVYVGNGAPWSNPTLTAADARPQLWQTLLAGACGANHGNHEGWTCGWVNGELVYPDWIDVFDGPDHVAMRHLADFFDSFQWWQLCDAGPDDGADFITGGRSSNENAVSASFTRRFGAAYIPHGGEVSADLTVFPGPVLGWYFDPTSGAWIPLNSGTPFANDHTHDFDPPLNAAGEPDMLLFLKVAA